MLDADGLDGRAEVVRVSESQVWVRGLEVEADLEKRVELHNHVRLHVVLLKSENCPFFWKTTGCCGSEVVGGDQNGFVNKNNGQGGDAGRWLIVDYVGLGLISPVLETRLGEEGASPNCSNMILPGVHF